MPSATGEIANEAGVAAGAGAGAGAGEGEGEGEGEEEEEETKRRQQTLYIQTPDQPPHGGVTW